MKHLELIKLVNKNADLIDRAYRQDAVESIDKELVDATLFIKINDRYKLNKNYLNFVDSVLQRVDYSIIFGDYEKEYKELIKLKKRFLESKNSFYKKNIVKLIENLYEKFINRDREIQILILRLENDTSLDIDILLENATDILDKIYELIDANEKVGHIFRDELRGVDEDIDTLLQSISVDILKYIQNIDEYIVQINKFITQTQKRRQLNKQIINMSNIIIQEKTKNLDSYLHLLCEKHYFTHQRSQKNKISIYPVERDVYKLRKDLVTILENFYVKPPKKEGSIKQQQRQMIDIVNLDTIIDDLEINKSDDIFNFILTHKELANYEDKELIEQAFKVYLSIGTREEVFFTKEFNKHKIKVATWE